MSEWRPIETAPKDGTAVDLWVVFPHKQGRWVDMKWTGDHACNTPPDWTGRDRLPLNAYVDKPIATHWMPLPEPPK